MSDTLDRQSLHPTVRNITTRIRGRSQHTRAEYLDAMKQCHSDRPARKQLSCCNLAHGFAAQPNANKQILQQSHTGNLAIISAYNDLLSAHAPYRDYPEQIKDALTGTTYTAQVAAGVPAMCDGITQGQVGMELSLFSRDVIALSTAIALSHGLFDGIICLGICDKIVPGLLIGALRFGFLPTIFIPAGPMPSGISNRRKAEARQQHSLGLIKTEDLLATEMQSYHTQGTCTFYGTANTNQLVLEAMGLQLPGASFINPEDPLRPSLTKYAATQLIQQTPLESSYQPLYKVIDEAALVNGMVALLASGGSTNHTIHLVAIAQAAGIQVTWEDFHELSSAVPLLTEMYPNGQADVNDFQAAGGTARFFSELFSGGFLHSNNPTVFGQPLSSYSQHPTLTTNKKVKWHPFSLSPEDKKKSQLSVIYSLNQPAKPNGGIKLLNSSLGQSIIKVSALADSHLTITAPAKIFDHHEQIIQAFKNGELNCDFIAVLLYQGPKANGMPELHSLTPPLTYLLKQGYQVGLITDGRLSGASGSYPAAIHMTPEAIDKGLIANLQDGDLITIDANQSEIRIDIDLDTLTQRPAHPPPSHLSHLNFGRELFGICREKISAANQGASIFKL